jgi:hypothetical protein
MKMSGKMLVLEGMERFFTGTFAGVYQHELLDADSICRSSCRGCLKS